QQRNDRRFPGQIDELLVRENRVAVSRSAQTEQTSEQRERSVQAKKHSRGMPEARKTHSNSNPIRDYRHLRVFAGEGPRRAAAAPQTLVKSKRTRRAYSAGEA